MLNGRNLVKEMSEKVLTEAINETTTRKEILDTATKYVCGQREEDYGTPEDNFNQISKLWNAYLGDNVTDAHDVAIMMSLLKVARIRTGRRKADSYIDLAGYAACGGEIALKNNE